MNSRKHRGFFVTAPTLRYESTSMASSLVMVLNRLNRTMIPDVAPAKPRDGLSDCFASRGIARQSCAHQLRLELRMNCCEVVGQFKRATSKPDTICSERSASGGDTYPVSSSHKKHKVRLNPKELRTFGHFPSRVLKPLFVRYFVGQWGLQSKRH